MATKKSSTSKTARVMNLLSKSREEAPTAEETAVAVPSAEESAPAAAPAPASEAAAPAPVHTAPTPPIITAMQADSAISHQVMSALETALDSELAAEAPQAAPVAETVHVTPETEAPAEDQTAPVEETAPAEVQAEAAPVEETVPAEAQAETAPVEEQAAPAEAPATAEESAPAADSGDDDFDPDHEPSPPTQFKVDRHSTYVNVMETLVEEKAAKYIDLFGLCKCHRCVADVKAYALNHLTPKYVVMLTGEVIPRISVYEGQFSADVTAQILTACKVVMANPRHDLPQ